MGNIFEIRGGEMTEEQVRKYAIIFDFDGVLRSISWGGLMVAYIEIIKAKGKNPIDFFMDLKTFRAWFNMDWHKNMESIDGGVYRDDPFINALFHQHYDSYVQLFPWVESLLTHLSKRYHLAILSSSMCHSIKEELGAVARFFPIIVGSETIIHLKPHPEGVIHILNYFGVLPENALIIGDSPQDFYAGVAAEIWTGMVTWGITEPNILFSLNADMYFKNPEELFQL